MGILVRRSNLLVRVTDADAVKSAWRHNADAITLDLEGTDSAARSGVQAAIQQVAQGAAEVFVKVDPETMVADLETAVWPGLRGILLNSAESFVAGHETDVQAVRITLGPPETRSALEEGLTEIVRMVSRVPEAYELVV